jgi:hypothetical protein
VTASRAARYALFALLSGAPVHAQSAAPDRDARAQAVDDADRIRAALEKPPSKLTLQERRPDFSVHIEKRRPMQDIFDTPPWQLPPIGWQPPAWGTGINLLSVVSYVAKEIRDARYAHDERKAREEVQQSIADWCAAQENRAAIQICSTSPASR